MCCASFCSSLLDCIVIPFTVISIISPNRWSLLFYAFTKHSSREQDEVFYNEMTLRIRCMVSFFGAIFDILTVPFAILLVIFPLTGRILAAREEVSAYGMCLAAERREEYSPDFEDQHKVKSSRNRIIIRNGASALVEIFLLLITGPFIIAVPSVWPGVYKGVRELLGKAAGRGTDPNRSYSKRDIVSAKIFGNLYSSLQTHLLWQVPHALLDLGTAPLLLMALLSPIRHRAMRKAISSSTEEYNADQQNARTRADVGDYDYGYIHSTRKAAFQIGLLAISDTILLPLLLPLWCTHYRYAAIKGKLNASEMWGYRELYLIMSQAGLLLIDAIVLLPLLPMLYLTRLRWPLVHQCLYPLPSTTSNNNNNDNDNNAGTILETGGESPATTHIYEGKATAAEEASTSNVFEEHSSTLYLVTVEQFALLLLDVLLLPLTLLVLLSYRR
jgi:hypothetical protein